MLKKTNRITRDKEFDRAFKTGQSFYTKILGFKVVDNGLEADRLGILISTKVSKKAVIRNKIRRQIREIVQSSLSEIRPGKDLVIIVFPQILDKEFKDIKDTVDMGLKKLRLYK